MTQFDDLPELVRHVTWTRNYGILGGYLECEFQVLPNGDPTGITRSWHHAIRQS